MSTIRTQFVGPLTGVTTPTTPVAFSSYLAKNKTITVNNFTKVPLSTEDFDTNNNFDSTTNYRFTPTIAGYYQFNFSTGGSGASTTTQVAALLYKNGATVKYGSTTTGSTFSVGISTGSALVYMNGSTDYVELYTYISGTGTITLSGGTVQSYLQGYLVCAA
jgi:hypothetical protein